MFGLVGETSFGLYRSWRDGPKHVFGRDERNVAIMADAYARFSYHVGVAEVPGVGASYVLPALTEAYSSCTPMVVLVSDVQSRHEKRNTLTEYDKWGMFSSVVKEYINVYSASEIPRLMGRAFRVASSGRMGPVVLRFPSDVYGGVVEEASTYGDQAFGVFPSMRFCADDSSIIDALRLLDQAQRPVMVCGQGVLLSGAWDEVLALAEALRVPVGTTITGKGCFPEFHPLSIGVVGSRGGTKLSNKVVSEADLVFFVGTNTDSANTSGWTLPSTGGAVKIIHLDVDERSLGNVYGGLYLHGDAKLTLHRMLELLGSRRHSDRWLRLESMKTEYEEHVSSLMKADSRPVHPLKFIRELEGFVDNNTYVTADPGVGAIYSSAYLRTRDPGRRFLYNYSVGGLGYSLPAAVGAYFATRGRVLCLTTDGSMAFFEGELETLRRYNADVKVFVFNNGGFGWIRAAMVADYGAIISEDATRFTQVDYAKLADAHGVPYTLIDQASDLSRQLGDALSDSGPALIEVPTLSEDRLVPPVPEWEAFARKLGLEYVG